MTSAPAGHAIAVALEAEGVTSVFGIPGGHILPVYDAVYSSSLITSILVRHEHAAARRGRVPTPRWSARPRMLWRPRGARC